MTVPIIIHSGTTPKNKWTVGSDGAGLVQQTGATSLPPGAVPNEIVYSQFFDSVGDGSGSIDMNVDGSVSPILFKIKPDPDKDIIISRIVLFLSDSQIQLKRFGFIPELTIGFEVDLFQAGESTDVIPFATTNMNLIQFAGGNFGQFDNIDAANNDALLVTFDLGVDVRIVAGTLDELQARVNDDLTGLEEFTALGLGKKLRQATV
ncbi:MAG: hypothetical protein ACW987_08980 [Candidatus Thorarchaeota archaeon]|jgi:hypothetical protein